MNFGPFGSVTRSVSPAGSSRGSSPGAKVSRRPLEEDIVKNDKAYRRYAAAIERTLGTWEIAPAEWSDYIAFLSRLIKTIQSAGAGVKVLPQSNVIASKLAQCLNPGLPSGVHQKTLEVYSYIFSTFGQEHVANRLNEYLPGLCPLLSFSALSVRPALYDLLEDYIICLSPTDLRPVLKSLILSILPTLEDETSEDFDRALSTITRLQTAFTESNEAAVDLPSFFWQSVFLSVITSPPRRQGALNYLIRQLPKFITRTHSSSTDHGIDALSSEARIAVSPEPGLLIRAFACGLADLQALVQRGFLDLLITHLPLDSPVLQHGVQDQDIQLLISAASSVLLRRDMSLNRRIWQWFLGPEPKDENADNASSQQQLRFFQRFGLKHLETCLLETFSAPALHITERARPFRISLSMMDRWEIGGQLVPRIFLPAVASAYTFSQKSSAADTTELLKSASLFFDGVESRLIWSKLFDLASTAGNAESFGNNFALLQWILETFNVSEEEMMDVLAPLTALYLLNRFVQSPSSDSTQVQRIILGSVALLLPLVSAKALAASEDVAPARDSHSAAVEPSQVQQDIAAFFDASPSAPTASPYQARTICSLLVDLARRGLRMTISNGQTGDQTQIMISIITILLQKAPNCHSSAIDDIIASVDDYIRKAADIEFHLINSFVTLISAIDSVPQGSDIRSRDRFGDLEAQLTPLIYRYVSPSFTRHNIEAVRLLWRVDSIFEEQDAVQSSIQSLLAESGSNGEQDALAMFLNLWTLSQTQPQTTSRSPVPSLAKRTSSLTNGADSDKNSRRLQVLSKPLMNVIDLLTDAGSPASAEVSAWLNTASNFESIVSILFDMLETNLHGLRQEMSSVPSRAATRTRQDALRSTASVLTRIDYVLQATRPLQWFALEEVQRQSGERQTSAPSWLANVCLDLLPGTEGLSAQIHQLSLCVTNRLLTAPGSVSRRFLSTSYITKVVDKLADCIKSNSSHLQAPLLQILSKMAQLSVATADTEKGARRRSSQLRRTSGSNTEDASSQTSLPIRLVVQVIRQGFSSPSSCPYFDSWLAFLGDVCPLLGDGITTVLIPLTETICGQLQAVFAHLQLISRDVSCAKMYSPDLTAVRLIDALGIILQSAHAILVEDDSKTEQSPNDSTSTVLSSVTPNLFRAQAPPSKNAKNNTRLTVIIASKDVVKACVHIWKWASSVVESAETDRRNAATTAYTAMKLRNKARHMLEEIFAMEPLESLEVVVSTWSESEGSEKDMTVNLLHALTGRRPRNTLPAVLDALCSRANPAMLSASRQSSLTSDLSATTLALFYSAYVESLEDDALDEIWADCTSFYKDVLSNPLPFRQILPALIWIAAQLATKLDNTNYGEQKKMRRELGDNFQRLIAATFVSVPSSLNDSSYASFEQETSLVAGLQELNLVVILREVITRAELILETADRISLLIVAVSTNIITPVLRSKTFPARVNADILALVLRVAKKAPLSKAWRNDVSSALHDPRFTLCPTTIVERSWLPIFQQWTLFDKEKVNEILSRVSAPSSAGIMFGVGASAARLDADRKTQLNLRRICLLLLASPSDTHVEHFRLMEEKLVELFEASNTSSPSLAVKAELFMLLRALLLSSSSVHFAPFWPLVNDNLQAAMLSMRNDESITTQNNLSLLQACKLLDLLATLSPDDFQLSEWIYVTSTTDAVYHGQDWRPVALSDQLAESLALAGEDSLPAQDEKSPLPKAEGLIKPLLMKGSGFDSHDIKAISQDNFVASALKPFLDQLSITTYENRYRMEKPDVASFRRILLEDIQDPATIVS
ncbi:hypothetical protein MRB53_040208 [Persea americana]|nr:hypothetical protein MRB53_040208 [Persea americana]